MNITYLHSFYSAIIKHILFYTEKKSLFCEVTNFFDKAVTDFVFQLYFRNKSFVTIATFWK